MKRRARRLPKEGEAAGTFNKSSPAPEASSVGVASTTPQAVLIGQAPRSVASYPASISGSARATNIRTLRTSRFLTDGGPRSATSCFR